MEELYFPQFSSLQMWTGGVASGIWIVLASRLCPEVTTVTSGWKPWMLVQTSLALWGLQKHVHAQSLSCVRLFETPWTSLSMGFSCPWDPSGSSVHGILQARILEWVLPFPPLGDLPDPGVEPMSPASRALQEDSLLPSHWGSPL